MDNPIFVAFKNNKKAFAVIFIALLGILLLAFGAGGNKKDIQKNDAFVSCDFDDYKLTVENEIASLCSSVEGVGKCKVYVTFERGPQTVYKGSSIVEIKPAVVKGVVVACRGADTDAVRVRITDMMCALFDIGANHVAVLKLNS